jgi:hypothetical protein
MARIDADPDLVDVPVNIGEALPGSPERQSYLESYESVSRIMGLVGEPMPELNNPDLLRQLARLKPTYELFSSKALAPEISISPVNRRLSFWKEVAGAVEASPLNPNKPGSNEKVLRSGGLWVSDEVSKNWNKLTDQDKPSWLVEVISSLSKPHIVSVTSYGYKDDKNQTPKHELSQLLQELGQPEIADRTGRKGTKSPLVQPDIHPSIENYTMHQISSITRGIPPLDAETWSWLDGTLPSGSVPAGSWFPDFGRVRLRWCDSDDRFDRLGVRPSGRG